MNSVQEASNELSFKLNEIRLSKNHPLTKNKVFILLEGKTDIKLFRNIFNNKTTNIYQLIGKEKIIQALEILQNEGIVKIFGIKDADFDNLDGTSYDNINLFITDYADMEIQMIESQAFESLINEFAHDNCYKDFLLELKDKLYQEASIIGYLRWYNEKNFKENGEYLFKFKGLNFSSFTEVKICDISINTDNFFTEIIKISKIDLTNYDLKEIIDNLKEVSSDFLQICNGHDMANLLACLFRDKNNSDKGKNINKDRIEEALRLSYAFDDFTQTKLYSLLRQWQETNSVQILSN